MIGIIDYGSGNIQAIATIYKNARIPFKIVSNPDEFDTMDRLILPGVGAFDETMALLENSGITAKLNVEVLQKKKPILGICVGMQIMGKSSDEGELPGLGWIDGVVKKFDSSKINQKPYLPHMGWNVVKSKYDTPLFENIDIDQGFYFVHSYYFECKLEQNILGETDYGEIFSSAIKSNNIIGAQFHPEKSHSNGTNLLLNFATKIIC